MFWRGAGEIAAPHPSQPHGPELNMKSIVYSDFSLFTTRQRAKKGKLIV
jgi:hypothetical protein